jgi:hypothetical protein
VTQPGTITSPGPSVAVAARQLKARAHHDRDRAIMIGRLSPKPRTLFHWQYYDRHGCRDFRAERFNPKIKHKEKVVHLFFSFWCFLKREKKCSQ